MADEWNSSVEYRWNDNWQGKTEIIEEYAVPVPLCPLQIPHGLLWDRFRAP
jgi:hypothetical protein